MEKKIILDLCGGTGAWSKPYKDAGYEVHLITLPEDDVRTWNGYLDYPDIRGILAAPPCTEFSLAKTTSPRDFKKGLAVVDACLRIVHVAKPAWWALENPVGMLVHWLGNPKMYFQPWNYGDPWTKRTALWGSFSPPGKWFPVKPKYNMVGGGNAKNRAGLKPSLTLNMSKKTRAEVRGKTPPGFAKAFFEANP